MPNRGGRDRIVAWVAAAGGARQGQIAAALGLPPGRAGQDLAALVAAGRLCRPARGFYCAPGQEPADIPRRRVPPAAAARMAAAARAREQAAGEKRRAGWADPGRVPVTGRDRIVAFVAAAGGGAWQADIAAGLGLPPGVAAGQLHALVAQGRLARPRRGWYVVPGAGPGQVPAAGGWW